MELRFTNDAEYRHADKYEVQFADKIVVAGIVIKDRVGHAPRKDDGVD